MADMTEIDRLEAVRDAAADAHEAVRIRLEALSEARTALSKLDEIVSEAGGHLTAGARLRVNALAAEARKDAGRLADERDEASAALMRAIDAVIANERTAAQVLAEFGGEAAS